MGEAPDRRVDLTVGHHLAEHLRPGVGIRGVSRRQVVHFQECLENRFRVVVGQFDQEAGVVGGRVHEFVKLLFVPDFAQHDRNSVVGEPGREGPAVQRRQESRENKRVVGAGAEGVHLHFSIGDDEVAEGDPAETCHLLGRGRRGWDVEERAQLVELRGQDRRRRRVRLDRHGVGPQVDPLDESLGGRREGAVVVELEKGRVRPRRESSHGDVVGVAAEEVDVFGRPLEGAPLVPKAKVGRGGFFVQRREVGASQEPKQVESVGG